LITPRGKAIRVGSVVAAARIPVSARPYQDHHASCLFFAKGTCGECIQRCPIGAISKAGHDKKLCRSYGRMCRSYIRRHYGFDGTGCGFCQTGVACESGIPEGIRI
jgi:epoxyqueuosine reductase QueG